MNIIVIDASEAFPARKSQKLKKDYIPILSWSRNILPEDLSILDCRWTKEDAEAVDSARKANLDRQHRKIDKEIKKQNASRSIDGSVSQTVVRINL